MPKNHLKPPRLLLISCYSVLCLIASPSYGNTHANPHSNTAANDEDIDKPENEDVYVLSLSQNPNKLIFEVKEQGSSTITGELEVTTHTLATASAVGLFSLAPLAKTLPLVPTKRVLVGAAILGSFVAYARGKWLNNHLWWQESGVFMIQGNLASKGMIHQNLEAHGRSRPPFLPPPVGLMNAGDLENEEYQLLEEKYGFQFDDLQENAKQRLSYFWISKTREFIETHHRKQPQQDLSTEKVPARTPQNIPYLFDLYTKLMLATDSTATEELASTWTLSPQAVTNDLDALVSEIRQFVGENDLHYLAQLAQQKHTTAHMFVKAIVPSEAIIARLQQVLGEKGDIANSVMPHLLLERLKDFYHTEILKEEFFKADLAPADMLRVEIFARHILADNVDHSLIMQRYDQTKEDILAKKEALLASLLAYWRGTAPLYSIPPLRSFAEIYRAYTKSTYRDDFILLHREHLSAIVQTPIKSNINPALLAKFLAKHAKQDPYLHYLYSMLILNFSGHNKVLAQNAIAERFHKNHLDIQNDTATLVQKLRLFFAEQLHKQQHSKVQAP